MAGNIQDFFSMGGRKMIDTDPESLSGFKKKLYFFTLEMIPESTSFN